MKRMRVDEEKGKIMRAVLACQATAQVLSELRPYNSAACYPQRIKSEQRDGSPLHPANCFETTGIDRT
jgi:hypothetical protein